MAQDASDFADTYTGPLVAEGGSRYHRHILRDLFIETETAVLAGFSGVNSRTAACRDTSRASGREVDGMHIVWLTDIHLNGVTDAVTDDLLAAVSAHCPASVLIGGDIAEAPDVRDYLLHIAAGLDCPVYFVLGNHDYYFGSIQHVRQEVGRLCQRHPQLTYLTDSEPVSLSECSALVGHDGWADGRCGDYHNSRVVMSDHRLITELADKDQESRLVVVAGIGRRGCGPCPPSATAGFGVCARGSLVDPRAAIPRGLLARREHRG